MSDFSIPGVGTSKYGTDKLIEGLMKLERVPRDKAAERLKSLEDQKAVWLDFNRNLSTLRDEARNLYSFRNPFSERVAKSSNEDSLTASATREAIEQTSSILVERVAQADRFISGELAKDYKVPGGVYGFTVGDKTLELRFPGGTAKDFAEALNKKGGDLIRAQVIAVRPDTSSILIESLKTGSQNRLGFTGDSEALALGAGLMEKVASSRRELDVSRAQSWERPIDPALVSLATQPKPSLSLVAGGEAKLPVLPSLPSSGLVLEIEYRLQRLGNPEQASPPPGPVVAPVGSASYEGISVTGSSSATALPEWAPPPQPPRVEDLGMASLLGSDGRQIALPKLQDGEGSQKLTVKLADYLGELGAVAFRVRDTTRRLEVTAVRIFDPAETGGLKPKKPISLAQDALVKVDGVEAERPTNAVSDLIPGVTLNLKTASDKPIKLSVEPNRPAIQEAVVEMIGNYNRLMASINIFSQKDDRLIGEISYFTDDQRKTMRDRLGILQGDPTLSMLKTSLQRIMMNPYPTSAGTDMALLAQAGIASDARKPGGGTGYDVSKMRGYLEVDEESLKKALDEHFDAVRQLFGNDTNGDLIVDSGAGYSLDAMLKPYVDTGGIVAIKTGTIDTEVGAEKRTIASLDERILAKQDELKRKYGMMEGALSQMQGTSSAIDNFAKNGGQ